MVIVSVILILQAAWIVDDSDMEDSDSNDEDDAGDGMVLDENGSGFPGQEGNNDFDLDDDQASLSLDSRDNDEQTDVDSVMMVSSVIVGLWLNKLISL